MLEERQGILIVDDIPKNIQILGSILKEYDFDLEFATNGKEAVDWIQSKKFDLVLLDIMMPEMDGFEVCRIIKEDPGLMNTAVIFITAKNDTDSILKGFDYGAVDYITKPFNKKELLARIITHLTLLKQKNELEQSNEFKNKLLSVIGHDLREPVGSLKSYIETYLQYNEVIDQELKIFMNDISSLSENAYFLLENLLSWAKSKTGTVPFFPSVNRLNEIVNTTFSLFSTHATNKEIRLINEIDDNMSAYFDPDLIFSVIRNLIGNAIKFSIKGSKITVTARPCICDKRQMLEVRITDSGIGINEKDIGGLFNDTVHFSTLGTANEKGSGLGLKICKEFIEINGGKISVKSHPGKGTSFFFTLLHEKPE